jgi:hypothetical protein
VEPKIITFAEGITFDVPEWKTRPVIVPKPD